MFKIIIIIIILLEELITKNALCLREICPIYDYIPPQNNISF
jgi:hypothetical protein